MTRSASGKRGVHVAVSTDQRGRLACARFRRDSRRGDCWLGPTRPGRRQRIPRCRAAPLERRLACSVSARGVLPLAPRRFEEVSDGTESGRRGAPRPSRCAAPDRRPGGRPDRHACLLVARRYLGALHRRCPRRGRDNGHAGRGGRGGRAADRRSVGRAGAGRVVAADARLRARDPLRRLGAGGSLPARDARGLHLEQG